MKRKIVSALLALFILISMVTRVFAVNYNQQKNEIQSNIESANEAKKDIESQKKTALDEISDLEDSISQYQSDIRRLKIQIEDLEKDIETKNNEITAAEEDLEKKKQLLEDRLVAIYEEGQITFLDVLLSAESIWDYISMGTRVQELTEADNDQMDEVEKEMQNLEKARNELKEQKDKLDTAKKSAEVKEKQMEVTKQEKEEKVAKLTDQEKKVQKELEEYKKDLERIEEQIRRQAASASDVYSGSFSGTLGWPVSENSKYYNEVSSKFGSRNSPVAGASSNHRGIDIPVREGTPVFASADGYVLSVQRTSARGIFVLIKHANDLYTRYQHLSKPLVSEGQYVKRAQKIALSGSTGIGSGAHLHFEILTTPYYMTEINPLTCSLLQVPRNLIVW